jgi:hypothetical protein
MKREREQETEHEKMFSTAHVPTAAVALSIDGEPRLVNTSEHPITGRFEWTFRGVPPDLLERILADEVRISAKKMLAALEAMHGLLLQHRRRR